MNAHAGFQRYGEITGSRSAAAHSDQDTLSGIISILSVETGSMSSQQFRVIGNVTRIRRENTRVLFNSRPHYFNRLQELENTHQRQQSSPTACQLQGGSVLFQHPWVLLIVSQNSFDQWWSAANILMVKASVGRVLLCYLFPLRSSSHRMNLSSSAFKKTCVFVTNLIKKTTTIKSASRTSSLIERGEIIIRNNQKTDTYSDLHHD